MCGIFGQITRQQPIDPAACRRALGAIAHRGPDGWGAVLGRLAQRTARLLLNPAAEQIAQAASTSRADFFLGHRRLAIVDLAPEAAQPMTNETGTVWVTFNGEIYNHRLLRRELVALGHCFHTDHSDTEVLVHGYEQWGDRLVEHLRGMFALAILDLTRRRLFLARDRFGEKPLYYLAGREGVAFASEPKALRHLPQFDPQLDPAAVVDYLHQGFVPAPRSIFAGVRKLRAAECAVIALDDPARIDSRTYWTMDYRPDPTRSARQWQEAFAAELEESIRLRLMSDVPLGAFLSGGLDSTMVVRAMCRAGGVAVNTFSIGFSEPEFDESRWARQAAEHFGTRHRARIVAPADLLETVGQVAEIFDEPLADSSAVPTLLVSKLARQDVTVALSGDGGDELLAGYTRYAVHHRLGRMLDWLPGWLVLAATAPARALWPERIRGRGLIDLIIPDARRRYRQTYRDPHLVGLLRPEIARAWSPAAEPDCLPAACDPVDQMCAVDRRHYIPEDLMVKVDRTSMAVSLEARAPLLDHKLFELMGRMPLATRFDGRLGKLPFRQILGEELGPAFVDRPKRGFSVPLGSWFRGPLGEELRQTLGRRGGIVRQLFRPRTVQRLIDAHRSGSRDQSPRLWKLYMLEKWYDQYGAALRHPGRYRPGSPTPGPLPARLAGSRVTTRAVTGPARRVPRYRPDSAGPGGRR